MVLMDKKGIWHLEHRKAEYDTRKLQIPDRDKPHENPAFRNLYLRTDNEYEVTDYRPHHEKGMCMRERFWHYCITAVQEN